MLDAVAVPSESDAIEQACEVWERGYRDAMAAGREIPVVDVPAEYGGAARMSVEATQRLSQAGNRRSYIVSIDLAALERARQEAERAAGVAAGVAKRRNRAPRRRRAGRGK